MPDWLQRCLALLIALASAPILAVLAAVIRLDSRGPALFLAERIGERGRRFRLIKLRTMRDGAAAVGPGLSLHRDARVTRVGRVLRGYRIDELPQVWNVVRGDMRLVGPRPEDPRFVDLGDDLHRSVFLAKPGITGITQLAYASEAELLDSSDPEQHYRQTILPAKLALDARYLARRSSKLDLWILVQTLRTATGHPPDAAAIERALGSG